MKSRPVAKMFFSWESRRLGLPPPDGWAYINPAIVKTATGYTGIIRCLRQQGEYFETRNLYCRFDYRLFLATPCVAFAAFLDDPEGLPTVPGLRYLGIEDIRLFHHRGALRGIGTTWHITGGAQAGMVLLDIAEGDQPRIAAWRPLPSPDPARDEKNWMPVVRDEVAMFVYSVEPTRLVSDDAATLSSRDLAPAATGLGRGLRGSSPLIDFRDGFLAVVHETEGPADSATRWYFHRFLYFDKSLAVTAMSERFHFEAIGVEFVCGLCDSHDPARLVIAYNAGNDTANFGSIKKSEVWESLLPLA